MVIDLLDKIGDADTSDSDMFGGSDAFPDAVVMISLGGGKYAANNATTPGPDPMTVGLIAVFTSEDEAEKWGTNYQVTGDFVTKSLEEAIAIAVGKPNIHGLGLQKNARCVAIRWVR